MQLSNISKQLSKNFDKVNPLLVALLFLGIFVFILMRYDNSFKAANDPFSTYPSSYSSESTPTQPVVNNSSVTSLNNDLLPKNSTTEIIKKGAFTDFKELIGMASVRDTRNANLQLRSDPPIKMMETGPFNKSTITAEGQSRGLDICTAN